MVPVGMPELLLRGAEDVVPEPRLEVALHLRQVEVGARSAGAGAAGRCGRSRGRSRRGSPTPARRRRAGASLRGASRAAGPSASRRRSRSGGSPSRSRARRTRSCARSRRSGCCWPSIRFSQVGELESSKSAMKTRAPELRALMIILRSTGPVISTRRSGRSAGIGATVHSPARTLGGLRKEIRASSRRRASRCTSWRRARSSRRRAPKRRSSIGDEGERRASQNAAASGHERSANLDAVGKRLRVRFSARRSGRHFGSASTVYKRSSLATVRVNNYRECNELACQAVKAQIL